MKNCEHASFLKNEKSIGKKGECGKNISKQKKKMAENEKTATRKLIKIRKL